LDFSKGALLRYGRNIGDYGLKREKRPPLIHTNLSWDLNPDFLWTFGNKEAYQFSIDRFTLVLYGPYVERNLKQIFLPMQFHG
jgi:hypothetical protein